MSTEKEHQRRHFGGERRLMSNKEYITMKTRCRQDRLKEAGAGQSKDGASAG